MKVVDIYTDGSRNYNATITSWGFVVLDSGAIIEERNGILTGPITIMYQIGGECQAVIEALKYCKQNNFKCDIYFDYIGLKCWVNDLFGEKPWQTKNQWTKAYREELLSLKEFLNNMIKVKGHSNNEFNEYADLLAKKALE